MQITQSPAPFSSAYREAIFKIQGAETEVIHLDIYDHSGTTIIGKKRLSGASNYEVNVANYAKRQLDIRPLFISGCGFAYPVNRVIDLSIRCGDVSGTTQLTGGLEVFDSGNILSNCPAAKCISLEACDEISFITTTQTLNVTARFSNNSGSYSLPISSIEAEGGLISFLFDMKDIAEKLKNAGHGDITDYHTITIEITGSDSIFIQQGYKIEFPIENSTRICWWNRYGQIDYYTMTARLQESLRVEKEKIYTQTGYKTIGNSGTWRQRLVSEYENEATMNWLADIIASPAIWIEKDRNYYPVDIITEEVITQQEGLSQLILELRMNEITPYQHL